MTIKRATIYKIFTRMPDIETERLLLRRMRADDAEDMYEYASDSEVTRYLTWFPHPDSRYTRDYLEYLGTRYRVGDFFDWAITLKESGKMIGTCGFTSFDYTNDSAEMGYVLNPKYRGQGIVPEALRAVLDFGFGNLALHRAEAKFIEGNEASRRVMEKVGMKFEGIKRGGMLIKGEYRDIGICAVLRDEFYK
ncbi:MAG: GNAT family N-acetyltransferase [Ruminococcaceae bacterium]|nr:GNAT family N-acetyltransferase [Oscillospiraceae bacterium]